MNFCWNQFKVTVLLFASFLKVTRGVQILQVQLVSYYNPMNLEYRSDRIGGPYCCCGDVDICAVDLFNSPDDCSPDCDFILTVCANVTGSSANATQPNGECYTSTTLMNSLESISIDDIFPDQFSPILFNFFVDSDSSTQDLVITVLIHDIPLLQRMLDPIDIFTVEVDTQELTAPPRTYTGLYGISNISLGYVFLQTNNTVVETTTISVETTLTNFIDVTRTVTETVLQSPPSIQNQTSEVWLPIAAVTIALAVLAIVGLVVMIGVTVCIIKKNKRSDKFQRTSNQLSTISHLMKTNVLYVPSSPDDVGARKEQENYEIQYTTIAEGTTFNMNT